MMRKGFSEKIAFEQRPAGGLGKEPWGLRKVSQEKGTTVGIGPATLASSDQLRSKSVFLVSSLPLPEVPSPVQDCPGHWEDPRAPTSFLPPDPLELSNVGTVVHRLQAAFQEALDLYHLVSQAPGSGERAEGLPGTAWPRWPLTRWAPLADGLQ